MADEKKLDKLVKFVKIYKNAQTPTRSTYGSAGLDLYACIDKDIIIQPSKIEKVSCGIAIELPGREYCAFIFARSGLSIKHGITLANGVGVIDSDYRGEIFIGLYNMSNEAYAIHSGDRIAQMIILETKNFPLIESSRLSETIRNTGGFGSTGK